MLLPMMMKLLNYQKIGAKVLLKDRKNLSEEYILINDILKYSIEKLENIKKYDLIVF